MSKITNNATLDGIAPAGAVRAARAGAVRRLASRLVVGAALALLCAGQIHAQTVELVVVDVKKVALGLQASKLIGMDVRNAAGEKIGTIDDLVILPGARLMAVLQVGGFLGLGGHLVVVPFDTLAMTAGGSRASLPGGTKEALRKLPEFQYGKK